MRDEVRWNDNLMYIRTMDHATVWEILLPIEVDISLNGARLCSVQDKGQVI